MVIIPLERSCLTVSCLRRMCRDLPLYMTFLALPIAALLSQCIHTAGTGLGQLGISSKKFRSHSASSPALSKAISYDSIVDLAIQVCLDDFQYTAAPPSVNTYPLFDFVSLVPVIQLASQYPPSTAGYSV